MRIGGLQKLSLIDYPGKLACVVFTQGCNFRCGYCHNPELVLPECFRPLIPEDEVFSFLSRRRSYLDGVVVSGGEPTLQGDLIPFLDKIKRQGYLTKLDTNGSRPTVLKQLIHSKLVDYIAMDVKAPSHRYREVIGVDFPVERIQESIELIIHSGIQHEFRTTVVKSFYSQEDLRAIRHMVKGVQQYNLQQARIDENILDKKLIRQEQYSDEEFGYFKGEMGKRQLQEI